METGIQGRSDRTSPEAPSCIVVALLLIPLALACGDGPPQASEESGQTRLEAVPDTAPGTTFDSLEQRSDTVEVTLSEYAIQVPALLPPGRTVFRVRNRGRETHNFLVQRAGERRGIDDGLPPGRTGHVTMDLEPGDYTVLCTVAGHDNRGMTEEIEVPPAATLDEDLGGEEGESGS